MKPNTHAPPFSTAASSGQTLSNESFEGKVPVLMLFLPDIHEEAGLLKAYNAIHGEIGKRRMQLLAVTNATAAEVRQVAAAHNLSFPILADPSKAIFRDYDATNDDGAPMACSVVVDRTGTVAAVTAGVGTPQESMALLDKASDQFEMAVER